MLKSNLELYEHNQETYENIKDIWKRTNKVAILQATGTGKTYVIARILEDYKKVKCKELIIKLELKKET